ncbi:MAG: carboxypeptidase M32 [Chlamydiales bacterium]|nr:carboxypeptidase M32 [Chlamydiales bacterium]
MTDLYQKLFNQSREAKILDGITAHLGWDAETYMPEAAAEIRSEQRKLLAGMIHEKRTNTKYRKALNNLAENGADLSPRQTAAVREWQRDFRIATALPRKFVETFTKVTSDASVVWRAARLDNDFGSFSPWLEKIVNLCRKKADLLGYDEHPYDALLDLFEPYMPSKDISKLFGTLRKAIVPLLQKITASKQVDDSIIKGHFPEQQQMELATDLLKFVGFNMTCGRLDISTHPFSSASHPTDSRITTRVDLTDAVGNILTTLHEFGHGLYEQNLPAEEYGSPLGEAISNGIHESQSRFWETRIGLSQPFWTFGLPLLQKHFPTHFAKTTPQNIWRAINKVQPSLIRVEADEVTYTLHVILRYELEMQLIEGSLKVRDLPEAWNAKMKELLGVVPKNDSQGCLQDIHWSLGAFGYFPSYSLGNVYAAQLFETFEAANPKWQETIAKGEFAFVREWLCNNIHKHGKAYTAPELLKKVTGKEINADPFINYLNSKYAKVYAF